MYSPRVRRLVTTMSLKSCPQGHLELFHELGFNLMLLCGDNLDGQEQSLEFNAPERAPLHESGGSEPGSPEAVWDPNPEVSDILDPQGDDEIADEIAEIERRGIQLSPIRAPPSAQNSPIPAANDEVADDVADASEPAAMHPGTPPTHTPSPVRATRQRRRANDNEEVGVAQASVLLAIAQVKERAAFAFLSKRMSPSTATRLSKKGREIRLGNLSPQMRKPWESSDVDEWRKWVLHEAVYLPEQAELDTLQEGDAIPMRIVRTDKNEATRGELDLEAHPIKAKSRIVSQGFKDKQALTGKIDTDAPTLSNEGTGLIYQTAASEQWRLEQGDVDSAFISGGYLDPSRRLHFIVPKGGLPALPDLGWPALPEGTILGARKGSYGMKDAPLLWFLTHTGAMTDLGMIRSRLNKAFFLHYAADGSLDGMIGVHVDDDLITGTDHFFDTVVKELRKRFNYGKWHQANRPGESFVHCGRRVTRGEDGSVHLDMQSYVESVLPIKLDSTRKAKTEAKVTHEERSSLWSKVPQLAWLVRGVNPYISFRVATLQQRLHDVDLTVEAVKEFNSTLADAKRRMPTHVFHPIPLRDAVVIAVGDASLGNVGKTKTRSQGGCVTLIGEARMAEEGAEGRVSVVHWRSHRIKRVVRSTIASECFAAIEAVEEADIWRAHLAEAFHFHGKLDLKQWEAEVNSCRAIGARDGRQVSLRSRPQAWHCSLGTTLAAGHRVAARTSRERYDLQVVRHQADGGGLLDQA